MSAENNNPAENSDPFESVTIRSCTAEEFLQNLDETHERWGSDRGAIDWVFRGQNDARWELIPSLFRPWHEDIECWDEETLAIYEIGLIDLFINNANLMNLPIPNNSLGYVTNIKEGHTTKREVIKKELNYEIEYDFSHVVFALARHSGVPTRLLDFTHNPLVAAYFAADITQLYEDLRRSIENKAECLDKCIEIITNNKGEGDNYTLILETIQNYMREYNANINELPKHIDHIAVWAIRYNDLRGTTIRLLEHPYAEILNLRMQEGVFLCDTRSYETEDNSCRSLDAELAKLVEKKSIYKLTLPYPRIKELLYLLRKKRIHSTYLTPTYEKVAEVVLKAVKKL